MKTPSVGDRVQVRFKHWARPGEFGTIVEVDISKENPYLIRFDVEGIGIEHRYLWMGMDSFLEVFNYQ